MRSHDYEVVFSPPPLKWKMQTEARDKCLKNKYDDGRKSHPIFIFFSAEANNVECYQVLAGLHKEKTPLCFMKLIYQR